MKKKIQVDLSKLIDEPTPEPTGPDIYHVDNFTMVMHMNMATEGILVHNGTIVCPTNPKIHGKTLVREVITPKNKASGNWGTGKACFHIEDGDAFETIEALNAHYNIKFEQPTTP